MQSSVSSSVAVQVVFGTINVGNNDTIVVTLTNATGANVDLVAPTFSNPAFALASTTCTATLLDTDDCTYTIRFQPTTAGVAIGVMTINNETTVPALVPMVGLGRASFSFSNSGTILLQPSDGTGS